MGGQREDEQHTGSTVYRWAGAGDTGALRALAGAKWGWVGGQGPLAPVAQAATAHILVVCFSPLLSRVPRPSEPAEGDHGALTVHGPSAGPGSTKGGGGSTRKPCYVADHRAERDTEGGHMPCKRVRGKGVTWAGNWGGCSPGTWACGPDEGEAARAG